MRTSSGDTEYMYINYTIPNNVTSAKIDYGTSIDGDLYRFSHNIPNSCLMNTYLQIRITFNPLSSTKKLFSCYDNSSSWSQIVASGGDLFSEESITWQVETGYPSDLWLEVGELTGTNDWNYTGSLSTTEEVEVELNETKIENYLINCVYDENNICEVPINMFSATDGGVDFTNLNLNYSLIINPIVIDGGILNDYLKTQNGTTNLTFSYESSISSGINITDLKINYISGNETYTVLAHDTTYANNISYNVTYYHSGWDLSLPRNIQFIEFVPRTSKSQAVQPKGQTSNTPILNISNLNYDSVMADYYMLNNETHSCVDLYASEKSGIIPNFDNGVVLSMPLSAEYIDFENNLTLSTPLYPYHTGVMTNFVGNSSTLLTDGYFAGTTALVFDGSATARVSVSDSDELDLLGDLTISLWVNSDNFSSEDIMLHKESGNVPKGGYTLRLVDGMVNFRVRNSDSLTSEIESVTTLNLNTDYLVTVTHIRSTGITNLYINGFLDKSETFTRFISLTNSDLGIGNTAIGFKSFNGSIAQPRIYNRSLTQAEITELYNNNPIPNENAIIMNTDWQNIKSSQSYDTDYGIWMYANYNCSGNTWRLFNPELYLRACCDGCEICSEALI